MSEIAQELHNLENKDSSSEDINESINKGEVKALESEDEFENIEISEEQSKNSTTKESEEEFESFQFEEMSNDFDSEVSGEIEDHGNMQSQLYNSSSKNSQKFTNYNDQNFDFNDFEEELENAEAQSNGNNWNTQDQIEDFEPENKSSVEGQSDFNSESLESENDTTFSNQPLTKITGQKMADSKLFFEDLCSDTVNSEISNKNVKNDKSKDSEDQDSWESL
jgi:hypothetical protein